MKQKPFALKAVLFVCGCTSFQLCRSAHYAPKAVSIDKLLDFLN